MGNVENTEKNRESQYKGRDLDIFDFFYFALRKIKVVTGAVGVGCLIACIYCFIIAHPIYEATAQIYVVNSSDSAINLSDLQIGSYLTSDYQWIFKTWEVNQQVINNLQLPYNVSEMQDMLTVTNPSNTRILLITFASRSAREATEVANEYAKVASQYISDYLLTDKPSTISVALEPLKPVRPRKFLTIAICAVLAGLISIWVLFIVYMRDDKLKTGSDLQKYMGVMPMAIIPVTKMSMPSKRIKGRGL